MANNSKVMGSIRDFLVKMKALDENIPEELAKDALQMTEEVKDALCQDEEVETEVKDEDPTEETKDEEPEKMDIDKKVEDAMVNVMRKYGLIKDGAMAALDEMENKLGTEDADGEEEVTVDPEKMNDSAKRKLLKDIKPTIANIKDSKQRKAVADAFAKALSISTTTTNDYSSIMNIVKTNTKEYVQTKDHQVKMNDDFDVGMEIARKYNPHYKEVK